jgi:hypothetical protein
MFPHIFETLAGPARNVENDISLCQIQSLDCMTARLMIVSLRRDQVVKASHLIVVADVLAVWHVENGDQRTF